ncbi:hypothetical protein Syun_028933 [Stephania yunnanensis]|uniref:Disease resistance protein RGA3 n=1 Tax=Stephania yunnanensis TaxID=152371 RepID=A0AAP0E4N6_9MAGN
MAEVVLEAVVGLLFENLKSIIQRELHLVWEFKADIRKLSATLSPLCEVLADAEVKQIKSKAIRKWLVRLKHAAYDAQDVLDDWAIAETNSIRHQPAQSDATGKNYRAHLVWSYFMSFISLKRLVFRYKLAKQIKEIRERFDGIAKEMSDFSLIKKSVDVEGSVVPPQSISSGRVTSSTSVEPQMYGRETDKENIVKMLLENINNEHVISVCPIVGSGGLGKTTLAQLVYNDVRMQKHFDVKIWICVSDDFNVKRLLEEIFEVVTKRPSGNNNLDAIQNGVKENLKEKKFLLVLDDVWCEKQDEWNRLKNSLTSGAKGSSIIVTTRLKIVASITKTISEPYHLGGLSLDNCWSLFRSYAFDVGKELEKPNLVRIGQEIVSKCGGLPLAAKALGSLVRFKEEENQWEQVRDSEIWELDEEEGSDQCPKILPALRLSYNNLSPRARQSFAYCSLFPKDNEMSKEELVHLWMANGLLQSERKEPEVVGENVFGELLSHSFFQDIEKNKDGKIKTVKIHDLMHDLASAIMKSEYSLIEVGMARNVIKSGIQDDEIRLRHVSIILSGPSETCVVGVSGIHQFLSSHQRHLRTLSLISIKDGGMFASHVISVITDLKNLRAVKVQSWNAEISLPLSFGDKLKHLRYLNLSGCGLSLLHGESFRGMKNLQILDLSQNENLKTLPDSMGEYMEHLRHLNLSSNEGLKVLPESFGNLTKLETLKLNECWELITLPQSTSKLCSLRQLDNEYCYNLRGMPSGIGEGLSRLEKLSVWVWGSEESENIEGLRGLSLLGGSLRIKIKGLRKEDDAALRDGEEVLTNKTNLSELLISFDFYGGHDVSSSNEQVLRILKPPSNIESLSIESYRGRRFPEWMEMRDPHSSSSFPRLRAIQLDDVKYVEEWVLNWRHKEECLPALQRLHVMNCNGLKGLPKELGNLATLNSLYVFDCQELVSVPQLICLESLSINDCSELVSMPQLELMTSLKELGISECPKLKIVFHGLRHLTSLQRLRIRECPGVVIPKEELDPLVALRGPSFLEDVDEELIHDQYHHQEDSTSTSETSI